MRQQFSGYVVMFIILARAVLAAMFGPGMGH